MIDERSPWYYTKPQRISKYLFDVFRDWGYYVWWNKSDDSESCYLKVNLGTKDAPNVLHVRISNHSIPQKSLWVSYNEDIYCAFEREGATNYVRFLVKMSDKLNKPLPHKLKNVKTGTPIYRIYKIKMQHRRKLACKKGYRFTEDRLYIQAN